MAGTILELDQLTADSRGGDREHGAGPHGDDPNRRGRRHHRRRRDHGEGEPSDGGTTTSPRTSRRAAVAVAAMAVVAAACGVDETERAARPGRSLRTARRTRRRDRLDQRSGDPECVDPATHGSEPRRHPATDRRVPDHASRRRREPRAVEVWSSTEKSGELGTTDAWMTEVAEAFNDAGITLADGYAGGCRPAQHRVGHRVPVHRPRRRSPRRLHAVEPAVDRNGGRVPVDDRDPRADGAERCRHRHEERDGR